ncbi:MAG: hypothetical protein IPH57_01930 [Saprospiraceae bacterium]|nr:hypothetical protein [Saprospiraceae bacterium]
MKIKILYIIILFSPLLTFAQNMSEIIEGSVTFKSSKNIYVKFQNTESINIGDTLFMSAGGKNLAALIVKQKSSTSCVTENISGLSINNGDKIIFINKIKEGKTDVNEDKQIGIPGPAVSHDIPDNDTLKTKTRKEIISGRLSLSTNADIFTDNSDNHQRLRTGLSFNVQNINHSPFSTQVYLTYRHRYGIDQQQTDFYNDFKVFSLAFQYAPGEKFNIWLGRKMNQSVANIGAIDGLQGEYSFNKYGVGIFAGTRPDFTDFSFNSKLPQFGAYVVRNDKLRNGIASTTLAFAEQQNNFKTDRRFLYFQHNNSLVKNLNVFLSTEFDLYEKIDSQPSNKFSLTSLYFSARYRVLKNLSFSASYDNRRNVIYYESYQTFIDQLLAQETRQGFRLQANYSPVRNISVNASAFVRYQGDNPKPTTNYVGNLSFNKIPLHNVSLSLSGNILESVYFKGTIIGGRISDNFMKGKLNLELNYRNVNYSFFNTESNLKQHIAGANLSFNIFRKTSLMLSYEGTFDKTNSDYHRYYVTINQRFKN